MRLPQHLNRFGKLPLRNSRGYMTLNCDCASLLYSPALFFYRLLVLFCSFFICWEIIFDSFSWKATEKSSGVNVHAN